MSYLLVILAKSIDLVDKFPPSLANTDKYVVSVSANSTNFLTNSSGLFVLESLSINVANTLLKSDIINPPILSLTTNPPFSSLGNTNSSEYC